MNVLVYSIVRPFKDNDLAKVTYYVLCDFIGSIEIPVEFTQSGPKSLELPPRSSPAPSTHIVKAITCWGVVKQVEFDEFTTLCSVTWPRLFAQKLVGGVKQEGGRRVW